LRQRLTTPPSAANLQQYFSLRLKDALHPAAISVPEPLLAASLPCESGNFWIAITSIGTLRVWDGPIAGLIAEPFSSLSRLNSTVDSVPIRAYFGEAYV
jgi:hypothetical protein